MQRLQFGARLAAERQRNQFGRIQFAVNKEPRAQATVGRNGEQPQVTILRFVAPLNLRTVERSKFYIAKGMVYATLPRSLYLFRTWR